MAQNRSITYKKQRHRYTYQKTTTNKGHIKWAHSPVMFCGIPTTGYNRTLLKFDPDRDLCETCMAVLKRYLAEEYGIDGW